jgi:hypothetical protein
MEPDRVVYVSVASKSLRRSHATLIGRKLELMDYSRNIAFAFTTPLFRDMPTPIPARTICALLANV